MTLIYTVGQTQPPKITRESSLVHRPSHHPAFTLHKNGVLENWTVGRWEDLEKRLRVSLNSATLLDQATYPVLSRSIHGGFAQTVHLFSFLDAVQTHVNNLMKTDKCFTDHLSDESIQMFAAKALCTCSSSSSNRESINTGP